MNVTSPANPFEVLWRMGYRRLCPITPPGCPVAPESTLALRMTQGVDNRGKAPGNLRDDGVWTGKHNFLTYEATERDLETWNKWGAGVGIVTVEGTAAIDADCRDPAHAGIAREEIEGRFGPLPQRIGRAPKALYPCRTSPDFNYRRIDYGEGERVEILVERQFVAWGIHPGTLAPYQWTRRLVPYDELPYAEPTALLDLLDALKRRLPDAREAVGYGGGPIPDQEGLKGPLALVSEAVEATDNTSTMFPTRDHYRDYGYAIKAALPDHPEAAFSLFSEWCSRWKGGENEPETVESDWRRMKPPFRRGASWLYEMAERSSHGRFSRASAWFETTAEPLFPADPPLEEDLASVAASEFEGSIIPSQTWLVEGLIPARQVTLLYGDGGTGKSLASLQLCFSAATGTPWLGRVVGRCRSLFITAEDELDELHRRLAAIASGTGLFFSDMRDLHLVSLAGKDAVLAAPSVKTGLMEATALYERLRALITRLRPGVLVLDTLADLFGGDEIKRIQARQFIRLMHALTLGLDFDLTVILLAHPSVAGMNSGTGTSGNTAWSNSVRSRLYLERRFTKSGSGNGDRQIEPDPDVRVLSAKKANRARQGAELLLRWEAGRFEAVETADVMAVAAAHEDEIVFLEALDAFTASGRRVSDHPTSPTYAPRMFEGMVSRERLTSAMQRLFSKSLIHVVSHGSAARVRNHIERIIEASDSIIGASDPPSEL